MKLVLVSLLFASCLAAAFAGIGTEPLKKDWQYGKAVEYCEWKGLKILKGQKFQLLDCTEISCDKGGLHENIPPPYQNEVSNDIPLKKQCVTVTVKCKLRLVRADNYKKRCPKKLRKQYTA